MEQYYYIDKNGQQQGPIIANELPRYGVTKNTQVWKQGMANWQTVENLRDLSALFPPTPPNAIPPPLPQNSFKSNTNEEEREIVDIINKVGFLVAIEFYMDKTGISLMDSKKYIDEIVRKYNLTNISVETVQNRGEYIDEIYRKHNVIRSKSDDSNPGLIFLRIVLTIGIIVLGIVLLTVIDVPPNRFLITAGVVGFLALIWAVWGKNFFD